MRVEFLQARTGDLTVQLDGRFLHSRYDPRREALRFTENLKPDYPDGTTVLIGDGIGALRTALTSRYPGMRVISIEPVPDSGGLATAYCPQTPDRLPVSTEDPTTAGTLLKNKLHALEMGRVQTITWSGAVSAVPAWTETVQQAVLGSLHDLQAELATVGSFGRLWISNAIRHSVRTDTRSEVTFQGTDLVVAAAGPGVTGLNRFIPLSDRTGIAVAAAGSALRYLSFHGYEAALAAHTDGGVWARRYIHDMRSAGTIPALSLRASPGPVREPMLFRTGWVGERLAPDQNQWPRLTEQPTVAASLVELANAVAPGKHLILAGVDLCTRDLLSHARPHRNDQFIQSRVCRLLPEPAIRWERIDPDGKAGRVTWADGTGGWQTPALAAYRAPLATALETYRLKGGVSFVDPSPVWRDEPTLPPSATFAPGNFRRVTVTRPSLRDRRSHAAKTITRWRDELTTPPAKGRNPAQDHLDLLLHLAPIPALQWYRGTGTYTPLGHEIERVLERALLLLENVQ